MRRLNQLSVCLLSATAALTLFCIGSGPILAADQPKASGAKKAIAGKTPGKSTNAPQKRKSALVMLGSKDAWHMAREQVDAVAGLLTGYCQLAANFSDDPADFTVENIRKYDVVILYSALRPNAQKENVTKVALENVFKAVEAGTPLLSVHGGVFNTSIDGSPEIEEKIGCKYVQGPHYPYQRFKVKIEKTHSITDGVTDFTVLDEVYRLEIRDPAAEILASYDAPSILMGRLTRPGMSDAQKEQVRLSHEWADKAGQAPVLYTRVLGKGKIVVNILGHDEQALRNPAVRTLYEQSLNWLFSEK
jgi:type 1 glutamine amidotransferase